MVSVAIIGAGAAGLCAAKHLKAKGIDVTVFEIGTRIGGLWVYENDNGLSQAYKSLHVNSEAAVTAYKDNPFPPGSPLYPDHRQMTNYLESYAIRFEIVPLIRFGSKVAEVRRVDGRWRVRLEGGEVAMFDVVIVASGHQSVPRHPNFARDFSGEYLHAHSYRVPEPFAGKDVLVVGVGNSACDIAADICTQTASTTMACSPDAAHVPRRANLAGSGAARKTVDAVAASKADTNHHRAHGAWHDGTVGFPHAEDADASGGASSADRAFRLESDHREAGRAKGRGRGGHIRRRHEPQVRHDHRRDRL
jgi:cation diffusion facilitator CzcD-associated flavoprotein CzcO